MKRLLLIAILLIVGCSKPINDETLIEKDGLKYHPETKELYSGEVFSLYVSGKKEFEGSYTDGIMWSKTEWDWYENEQKKREKTYKNGKLNGLYTEWYENGQKEYESNWKDGKVNGLSIGWYKNGQKEYESNWKDGKEDGVFTNWYPNGQKKWEETRNEYGKLISSKDWNEDGSVNEDEHPSDEHPSGEHPSDEHPSDNEQYPDGAQRNTLESKTLRIVIEAPHSWGFLFVGLWVDLDMVRYISLLLFIGLAWGQNSFKIRPKYEHLKLINKWTFESMETITYAEQEEESEIVFKDDENTETLSFHRSGSISYVALNNEEMKKGRGIWLVKDNLLNILADSDTIYATYQIKGDFLTIITSKEESKEFYGYKTIVKYKKQMFGLVSVAPHSWGFCLLDDGQIQIKMRLKVS